MFVIPYATRARSTVPASFGRAFDRLFDEAVASTTAPAATRTPALDVHETDACYLAAFDLPGVAKEQVKVSVEGRRLMLETVAAADAAGDAAATPEAAPRTLYRERSTAAYARTVVLPAEVDAAQAQARFDNGVLTLLLPKRVASGATQVHIA